MHIRNLLTSTCFILFALVLRTSVAHAADPQTYPLLAGKHLDAGSISIWNDLQAIYIQVNLKDGWELQETHVHVATEIGEIPQTKNGNPKVGKFAVKKSYPTGVNMDNILAYKPEGGISPYTDYVIAFHASIRQSNAEGKATSQETAWVPGLKFGGKNWATAFAFTTQPVCIPQVLPEQITFQSAHPGPNSYWAINILDQSADSTIDLGVHAGWCIELQVFMTPGVTYTANLLSTVNDELGEYVSDNWDAINYLLNHVPAGIDYLRVQEAIWHLRGGQLSYESLVPETKTLVDDALSNGEGFVPGHDDLTVLIVEVGPTVQATIIAVPTCALPEHITGNS